MTEMTLDELLNATTKINCRRCQGHSVGDKAHPSYCSNCEGTGYATVSRYATLTDAERVDLLEREVMRLRPDLAAKYSQPKARR